MFTEWKRTEFHDAAARDRYMASKKAFRRAQTQSDKDVESAKYKRVEKMFRSDRGAMWTVLKGMSRPAAASVDINKLHVGFRDTFNVKLRTNQVGELEAEAAVNAFLSEHAAIFVNVVCVHVANK